MHSRSAILQLSHISTAVTLTSCSFSNIIKHNWIRLVWLKTCISQMTHREIIIYGLWWLKGKPSWTVSSYYSQGKNGVESWSLPTLESQVVLMSDKLNPNKILFTSWNKTATKWIVDSWIFFSCSWWCFPLLGSQEQDHDQNWSKRSPWILVLIPITAGIFLMVWLVS